MSAGEPTRDASFGQDGDLTLVDRFGVWLSGRQIRRHVRSFDGLTIADVGCGYEATFARRVLPSVDAPCSSTSRSTPS